MITALIVVTLLIFTHLFFASGGYHRVLIWFGRLSVETELRRSQAALTLFKKEPRLYVGVRYSSILECAREVAGLRGKIAHGKAGAFDIASLRSATDRLEVALITAVENHRYKIE